MREYGIIGLVLTVLLTGCATMPVESEAGDHYYRIISIPKVALKADPLERIEAVDVVIHCGRFSAINRVPNDWSAEIVGPVSEETKLRMEAGHGSSSLCRSGDLDRFVTILICEPSCFDITASLSVFSYDGELRERKVSFNQSDLLVVPLHSRAPR
jgi:hypothetical protein